MTSAPTAILLLRDDAGAPYLLSRELVQQQELVALRLGEAAYLLPRETLIRTRVPEEYMDAVAELMAAGDASARLAITEPQAFPYLDQAGDGGPVEALAVRTPQGEYFLIPEALLERAQVTAAEQRAAVEQVLGADDVLGYTL